MINAVQSRDLLDQINLALQIHAEGRDDHHAIFVGVLDGNFQAELTQVFHVLGGRNFHAREADQTGL